jgi:hypothetical protein
LGPSKGDEAGEGSVVVVVVVGKDEDEVGLLLLGVGTMGGFICTKELVEDEDEEMVEETERAGEGGTN